LFVWCAIIFTRVGLFLQIGHFYIICRNGFGCILWNRCYVQAIYGKLTLRSMPFLWHWDSPNVGTKNGKVLDYSHLIGENLVMIGVRTSNRTLSLHRMSLMSAREIPHCLNRLSESKIRWLTKQGLFALKFTLHETSHLNNCFRIYYLISNHPGNRWPISTSGLTQASKIQCWL